jgi:hypothetical protein
MVLRHLLICQALAWAVLIDAPSNAGTLTIFLDEVLDQRGRGHPSFQNPKKNDK